MNASAYVRYAVVVAALAALGTLGLAPASSASTAGTIGADPIAITITNGGIVMKGLDRGGSRYVRFTKVLGPGETQQFRWYFPVDRSIKLRDLMSCTHEKMTCVVAGYGGMTRSIHFG